MSNEVVYVDKWLYGVLSGDATLTGLVGARIHAYQAPEGTAFPFVLYSFQGGADVAVVGGIRIFNRGVYQVKAVGKGDTMGALQSIADRIDTLLQGASGSVTGGIILACVREQPLAYAEIDNRIQYRHLGGLYRILVQGS